VIVVGPATAVPFTVKLTPDGTVASVIATVLGWMFRFAVAERPPESVAVR
jgi:hypothetical protein